MIMIHLYGRVSTLDQSLETQISYLEKEAEKFPDAAKHYYTEKVSGQSLNRPQFDNLLTAVRHGDVVIVTDIDRLGRSLVQLARTMDDFKNKGVILIAIHQGINTSTHTGRMMAGMIAVVAEFEFSLQSHRIKRGIETAKRNHRYKGRIPIDAEVIIAVTKQIELGVTVVQACKNHNISRGAYYKRVSSSPLRRDAR